MDAEEDETASAASGSPELQILLQVLVPARIHPTWMLERPRAPSQAAKVLRTLPPTPQSDTQQLLSYLMQSRTHQPGHWSPWETTADVKGGGKSRINPTKRRFYDDADHARLSHADVFKRHTSGPTHLEYDPPAVHPGGGGGFLTRAGLVSSGVPLTEAALMSNLL